MKFLRYYLAHIKLFFQNLLGVAWIWQKWEFDQVLVVFFVLSLARCWASQTLSQVMFSSHPLLPFPLVLVWSEAFEMLYSSYKTAIPRSVRIRRECGLPHLTWSCGGPFLHLPLRLWSCSTHSLGITLPFSHFECWVKLLRSYTAHTNPVFQDLPGVEGIRQEWEFEFASPNLEVWLFITASFSLYLLVKPYKEHTHLGITCT